MWLFVIQVIAIIAASMRGWGAKPIVIFVLVFVFSFIAGAVAGPDVIGFLQVVDYILIGVFIVMAIIGKEKEQTQKQIISNPQPISAPSQPRIKCPHCAEWIMPDANICRYCGNEVNEDIIIKKEVDKEELKWNDEYYYKLGEKCFQNKIYYEAKANFFRALRVSSPNSEWNSLSKERLLGLKHKRR